MCALSCWHIITGEYPPQPGGVSDYTALVARSLAATGDRVHVHAPRSLRAAAAEDSITVHALPGHFGPQALAELDAVLARLPPRSRVLVQYVPHMYGWKAMNVGFCLWLLLRRQLAPWVMFHEVTFPCRRGQRFRHNVLGAVNHVMAAMVAHAATRIFFSTPAWGCLLRRLAPGRRPMHWLPVPSNIPTRVGEAGPAALRAELGAGPERLVVGHFGTFGGMNADMLATALPPLLAPGDRAALLIGRGSVAFAQRLTQAHPWLAQRLRARGESTGQEVATALAACDLLVQPYPDGVSTRRGSLMAGLALGVPLLTTAGFATEPIWAEEELVALAPAGDAGALVHTAERLLGDPRGRRQLGLRGSAGYACHFSIEHTVRILREAASA
jgi:glycosyltransferase involved in cell wall biosynthesis